MYPTQSTIQRYPNVTLNTYKQAKNDHKLALAENGIEYEGTTDHCRLTAFINFITRDPDQKKRYNTVRTNLFELLTHKYNRKNTPSAQLAVATMKARIDAQIPYGAPLTGRDVKWIIKETKSLAEKNLFVDSLNLTLSVETSYSLLRDVLKEQLAHSTINIKLIRGEEQAVFESCLELICKSPKTKTEEDLRKQISLMLKAIPHIVQLQNNFSSSLVWAYTVFAPLAASSHDRLSFPDLINDKQAIEKQLSSMPNFMIQQLKNAGIGAIQELFQSPDWIRLIFIHTLHPVFLDRLSRMSEEESQLALEYQIRNLAILLISTVGTNIQEDDLYDKKNTPILQTALGFMSLDQNTSKYQLGQALEWLRLIYDQELRSSILARAQEKEI